MPRAEAPSGWDVLNSAVATARAELIAAAPDAACAAEADARPANCIDKVGRRRGVLVFRAIGADPTQLPQAQLRR